MHRAADSSVRLGDQRQAVRRQPLGLVVGAALEGTAGGRRVRGGGPVPIARVTPESGALGLVAVGTVQRRGQAGLPPDALGGAELAHQHITDRVVDQSPALLPLSDQVRIGQPAQRLEHHRLVDGGGGGEQPGGGLTPEQGEQGEDRSRSSREFPARAEIARR